MISFRDVSIVVGRRVLFSVPDRSCSSPQPIAITGPNGSGKSTLLRVLAGLSTSYRGTIEVLGGDPATRYQEVAYLPEQGLLWPSLTVAAQRQRARGDRWQDWWGAHVVDTSPFDFALPFELSSGQRRLAALSLVLQQPATVFLLDEPWSNLDERNRVLLSEILASLSAEGRLVLTASHQQELASTEMWTVSEGLLRFEA